MSWNIAQMLPLLFLSYGFILKYFLILSTKYYNFL